MMCASTSFLIAVAILVLTNSNAFAAEVSKAACDALHDEIENDFKKANFCNTDNDCTVIRLGG
jgi:hypothetical protein